MAKELRERGETLDKARIVVMLRGAHDRFHAAFQEACKLNKISVLVGFHLMLKSRQERARIANKIAKINNGKNLGGLSVLKKATDKDGNLTKSFLDKYLSDEGLIESSSEYLISQAEVQGFLIRVDENTWNWLS